jgi:hypothetical protein
MNATKTTTLLLCLAALAAVLPTALAATTFTNSYASESPSKFSVGYKDFSVTTVQFLRHFEVSQAANSYVAPSQALPAGYTYDVEVRNPGASDTWHLTSDTGLSGSQKSHEYTAVNSSVNGFRVTVHLPATRQLADEVELDFVIALNVTTSPTGNGGYGNPSIGHRVVVTYTDPSQTGTNQSTVYGGAGGHIQITDVELVLALFGALVFVVIGLVAYLVMHKSIQEKRFEHHLLIIGGSIILAFVATFALAKIPHADWFAFWRYIPTGNAAGFPWQVATIDILALIGIAALTWALVMFLPRRDDKVIFFGGLAAAVLVVFMISAAFFWLHIPIPWS